MIDLEFIITRGLDLERQQIERGELPERIVNGAWRPIEPNENPDPRFVSFDGEIPTIPCRLYGPSSKEGLTIKTSGEIHNLTSGVDSMIEGL